ncbi:MAG TPA: VTC domain-containing protein [Anaerohalosphaeraceae bacterium]|nr:VTC domain-containing protein [Anaerohalosphaeraceae bacterium]
MIAWSGTRKFQPALSGSERFERKFYLSSSAVPFAAHLLAHCCPADRRYARGIIHSVYYDSDNLDYYEESEQGQRVRSKVRVRWYDYPQDADTVPVFIELKSKNGFAGSKQRKQQPVSAQRLNASVLRDGPLPYTHIFNTLAEFDYHPHNQLHPMLLITYQRLRFVEPLTGSRISLDWNIRSRLVYPLLNRGEQSLTMEGAVIEIKGHSNEIPPTLRSLHLLDTDWSRYSKYATCMQSQLEKTGSFGRLMPSGRGDNM